MIFDEIKGVFKLPKKIFYFGKIKYATPYMHPRKFCSSIFDIRKTKPKYNRGFNFDIFGYNVRIGYPIYIYWYDLGWKDKFYTPRHEWNPSFLLYFFKWQFAIHWISPNGISDDDDLYWEMVLWYLYYSDKNILKAKLTWAWVNTTTKKSTWENDFLV